MTYQVKFTFQAIEQITNTIAYIAQFLLEPQVASKWSAFLKQEIAKLGFIPYRYPLVDEEPWHTKELRKMTVKNFFVYYTIQEEEQVVWITAVLYSRRDQTAALQELPL